MFLFLLIGSVSFSQDYSVGERIELNKKDNVPIVLGEAAGGYIVAILGAYQKKRPIYRLDQNLKVTHTIDYPVIYKTNRGGAMPTSTKDLHVLGDKIYAFSTIKVKKKAVIYYDVLSAKDLSVISEENVLYEYEYKKLVNARDFVRYDAYYDGESMLFHIRIVELISMVEAGNPFYEILKVDENMKKIYQITYQEEDMGRLNQGEVMDDGSLAFFSNDYKNEENYLMSVVDPNGEMETEVVSKNGKYLNYHNFFATKAGYFLIGVYGDTSPKENKDGNYNGLFLISEKEKEMGLIPFEEIANDIDFSPNQYKLVGDGKAITRGHYDDESNSIFLALFNTGKVSDAKISVFSYDLDNDDFDVVEVTFPEGTYSPRGIECSDGYVNVDFWDLETEDKDNVIKEKKVLELKKDKLSEYSWESRKIFKVRNGAKIASAYCLKNTELNLFMMLDDESVTFMSSE